MAVQRNLAAAVLLVVVLALAGLGVEAQVVPIANCWRTSNTGDAVFTILYFGYQNPGTETVNIPVGLTNTYITPPDVNEVPQSVFYTGLHGLSQVALITPDIAVNQTWSLTWILGNLQVALDNGKAVQECKHDDKIAFRLSIPDATSSNTSALVDILVSAIGLEAERFQVQEGSTATTIDFKILPIIPGSNDNTTQFEAMITLNNLFFNNDTGLRAQLGGAVGGNVQNLIGGTTSTDVQGTPVTVPSSPPTNAPVAPAPTTQTNDIFPVAHCWEPDRNDTDGHFHLYFGYVSTYNQVITIDPDTPGQNQFLGVPASFSSPVPVFYPGVNGFVARVHVRAGALVQWVLNGNAVLLNTEDADFACDESINQSGLPSVAAFSSGTYTTDQVQNAIDALSDVTRLPVSNIGGDFNNVFGGGFRALFNLTTPSVQFESVYTAMWRSVNDFHLANSSLNTQWNDIFGQYAANYSNSGTAGDLLGSQLPPSSTMHVPVAHCWISSSMGSSKAAYFGYVSNFPNTLSYLQGPNNFVANAPAWNTPQVLFPGYNGFSTVVLLSGASVNNTNVAWNLAGSTVTMDLTNTSQQCRPNSNLQFTIAFTGPFLTDIDQIQAAQSISNYVSQNTEGANIVTQFDPTVDGFLATVIVTPTRSNAQYSSVSSFISKCNSFNSYSVRSALSGFTNATAGTCQASGTSKDTWGTSGTTPEVYNYGASSLTLNSNCYTYEESSGVMTAYFGYSSSSPFSVYASSSFGVSAGGAVDNAASFAPSVFSDRSPFAAKVVASQTSFISWTVSGQTVSISRNDPTAYCANDLGAGVALAFERQLQNPPPQEPLRNYIAQLTGFPFDHILVNWEFDSTSDFTATVNFVPLSFPAVNQDAANAAASAADAAVIVLRELTTNATKAAEISGLAHSHLYSVKTVPFVPTPPAPVPVEAPSAPKKKGLGGAVTFAIVVGVLLGVGIIGGILFYFFKQHKGMCREEVERRPLLAE